MNYKEIIESRYNRRNWLELLHDIFGSKIKFWNTPSTVAANEQIAKQALWLGTITLSDEQTISVYEVELTDNVDILRNRRGIRDMLLTAWRGNGSAGAFMLCYRKNESVLRFSYVSEAWRFNNDGDYQKESTDTKRFTYLLGEGHRSRTAIQQFEKLKNSNLALADLTKAFSVDAVSDMFFDGYKRQYERFCQFLYDNKADTAYFGEAFQTWEDKVLRDYVKKMLGRLVFVQFLHRKGWAPNLLDAFNSHPELQDNFLDAYLEPLFGGVLNAQPEQRPKVFHDNAKRGWDERLISEFAAVPYLNGGLFESDLQDPPRSRFPKEYFSELFDFFDQYNFTIDENDPNDAEVGVDPEMLGRIFENLLEDNKDKGAFYTPKEIVQYMCRESLIAYLQTDATDDSHRERLRQFVETHDATILHDAEYVRRKIESVKICDPAIGSGAFPMGLLNELVACREALGLHIDKNANRAEIKKHIIQNSIYGVDIEKGAVDIARLRFWLSLVVDEDEPLPLPNLDYKIMQGNSLLEQYEGVDLSGLTQKKADQTGMLTIFDDMLDVYRKQLRDLLNEYYNNTDHQRKHQLQQLIADNVRQQLAEQRIGVDFGTINLAANDQFFLWHTWFNDVFEKGGFDIVIGNPPYGANIDSMLDVYKNKYKTIVKNYADIYKMFIGEGINILSSMGIMCYITPNTYLSQPRYKDIRTFIINYNVKRIVNLGMGVFENAVVPVCISLIQNTINRGYYNYYDATQLNKETFESIGYCTINVSDIVKSKDLNFMPSNSSSTLLFNDVFDIRDAGIQYHRSNIGLKNKGGNDLYERLFNENESFFKNSHPVWYGKLINRYYKSDTTNEFFNLDYKLILKSNEQVSFNKEAFLKKEKIIWRQTAPYPIATIDDSYIWFRNTIQCAWIKDEYVNQLSLKAALAIFNSKYIRFLYNKIVQESGRAFPQVKLTHLKKLPIIIPTEAQQRPIIALVDKILAAKQANPQADTNELEREIDEKVYELYGLTDEEVKVVEGV